MKDNKFHEIGSEFWLEARPAGENYALSGRTAIDLILQDIIDNHVSTKTVYMPAWCCESMLQPFVDRGVDICFYDVSYENEKLVYKIDEAHQTNILFITNYFGYDNSLNPDIIKHFKKKGSVVIYDRTHSLFVEGDDISSLADYSFASIRKWLGIPCGAILSKKKEKMQLRNMKDCPYLEEKIEAMTLKADYLKNHQDELKAVYLEKFRRFGQNLSFDYRDYKIDERSYNIWIFADREVLKKTRRNNAVLLHTCLNEIPQIKPIFAFVKGNCPLFVPVMLDSKAERDALRKYLTSKAIYCPIHWPKPVFVDTSMKANMFYDRELSLICDQRYSPEDIYHISDTIKDFYQ